MQMISASHLAPVPHEKKRESDVLYDLKDRIDVSKAVTVPLPAEACLFHHCQTLHHTKPNTTPRRRRAFAIHFMTPGTRWAGGDMLHAGFDHPVLRMRM